MLDILDLEPLRRHRGDAALVRIEEVKGSAPRDKGTEMVVTESSCFGTIGGGRLEFMLAEEARQMLAAGTEAITRKFSLGPEIGQCCGGRVTAYIQRIDADEISRLVASLEEQRKEFPWVYIFGAGHVGRSLTTMLRLLPFNLALVDSRAEFLSSENGNCERFRVIPEAEVRVAPAGSAFVIVTHDHSLDFLICAEALSRGDAAYVGMIGSKTKRARFQKFLKDHSKGVTDDRLVCPIGCANSVNVTWRDKRPQVIAAKVAAELLDVLL